MIKTHRAKYFSLEKIFKGVANHRRLEILERLNNSTGLTLDDISAHLDVDFRTISKHTVKMVNSGLIQKKYRGRAVEHSLTTLGRDVLTFARMLERKIGIK